MGYEKSAKYYDRIYSFKEYETEVAKLLELLGPHLASRAERWLDVACGTGKHLMYLKSRFHVEGLDRSPGLLAIARERNPEITFHCADMRDFELPEPYNVITCLFSSIGYMTTIEDVRSAISCMVRHLVPSGVLAIEPWFTPDQWLDHTVHADYIDDPQLKIARVNTSLTEGRVSIVDLHYLIGTPQETIHFVERHRLGLFSVEEMMGAFRDAGMEATFDAAGITGRGLYIGCLANAPDDGPAASG